MMIIKKNQIIVFILALLLITAGYLGVGQQNIETLEVASKQTEEKGKAGRNKKKD